MRKVTADAGGKVTMGLLWSLFTVDSWRESWEVGSLGEKTRERATFNIEH